ncbi:hypothetical protein Pfo_004673 [Paulownia fortunei]|nr:hypothetical protein Pfo_004673 [Paulownia fortunei]
MRSEPMQLVQLILPVESAHLAISYLGDLGLIQFKNLNVEKSPFQRTYAIQIKRCGEMARKLRFFRDQMTKAGLPAAARSVTQAVISLDDLEVKLGDLEAELVEINANGEKLQRSYNELVEYRLVPQKAGEFFNSVLSNAEAHQREYASNQSGEESLETPLLSELETGNDSSKQVKVGFITGLVPREKSVASERILFRATRGNVFFKQAIIDELVIDPVSGEKVCTEHLAKNIILKICEAFGANRYAFNEDLAKQSQMITEVSGRLSELKTTSDTRVVHHKNLLQTIGEQFEQWNFLVRNEKPIYHTLNMLSIDVTKKCLVAEGWSPVFATKQVQDALHRATHDSNSQVDAIFRVLHAREMPPTYFRTSKFTSAYQEIVDAYGVAKYQEANPGVFTIVTFPFLFAVMFGDWGMAYAFYLLHYILLSEKRNSPKLGDIMEMTFGGRYVIMLMALFSIYTGLIYNDFFSMPFELSAPSAYACRDPSCRDATTVGLIKVRDTHPFGVDPAWHGTRSELPFLNSLKMKMSILLGVAQMNLGIILSYFNAQFFKNSLNICLFGYLSVLIIIKWCTGSQADLYHVMIYMFLSSTDELGENQLFPGQKTTHSFQSSLLQLVLLLLALVSVPWMLLPKPFLLKLQHSRHQGESYAPLPDTEESLQSEANHDSHGHEEFEFSEVFVHHLIHTIEFVLGAVSNTASYLCLWALSLAHSELSSVFYEKVLLLAWGAFLHALRLHCVEFQNKFYEGDGYKFYPFSFALVNYEDE